jgi:hypothetical protein
MTMAQYTLEELFGLGIGRFAGEDGKTYIAYSGGQFAPITEADDKFLNSWKRPLENYGRATRFENQEIALTYVRCMDALDNVVRSAQPPCDEVLLREYQKVLGLQLGNIASPEFTELVSTFAQYAFQKGEQILELEEKRKARQL